MQPLLDSFSKKPIIYVTRDIERAMGLSFDTQGFYCITNATPFARQFAAGRTNIVLIEAFGTLSTLSLLEHPETAALMAKLGEADILVFKPSTQIERFCKEKNWNLFNPPAAFANKVEEKITQISWLGEDAILLPPHTVQKLKDVVWNGKKEVLQFNHSHTGEGTILLDSENVLSELKAKFPEREVRILQFIDGPTLTNNNVITDNDVLIGNISYQITGIPPFTEKPFATIGNDWGLAHRMMTDNERSQYNTIVKKVADRLRKEGWRGLFGIDVLFELSTRKLYLLEINARQPASTSYESTLQEKAKQDDTNITTFEAHLASLRGLDLSSYSLANIIDGARIVQRVTSKTKLVTQEQEDALRNQPITLIHSGRSDDMNSELVWIQSETSLLESHNVLNEQGRRIQSILAEQSSKGTQVPSLTKEGQGVVSTLTNAAEEVRHSYFHLPIPTKDIPCPYYNNKRQKVRGALGVLVGKGSPTDIAEEAKIISMRDHVNLDTLDDETTRKFLIDHNLGIDCSAFVYHILKAEVYARTGRSLSLFYPNATSLIRKLLARFRKAENTNVQTFVHDKNSNPVSLKDIQVGDMVIMLDTADDLSRDHILLIHDVQKNAQGIPERILYSHTLQWSVDGKYGHHVREGNILITDISKSLLDQTWEEEGKTNEQNETLTRARSARSLLLRRLRIL